MVSSTPDQSLEGQQSALSSRSPRHLLTKPFTKGRRKKTLVTVALVLLAWVVVVGLMLGIGAAEAWRGKNAASKAATAATIEKLKTGEADADLKQASQHLRNAHRWFDNPVTKPLLVVPYAGTQLRSAIDLAHAGATASRVVVDVSRETREITESKQLSRSAMLAQLGDALLKQNDRLADVKVGPSENLLSPLRSARTTAVENLNKLDQALVRGGNAAQATGALLGGNNNYLLVAANNAEMRAGSGMFLSVGLLQVENGNLRLGEMRNAAEVNVPDGQIRWPDAYEDNWGWMEQRGSIQNLMLSPRFDVSAPLAKTIWETAGQPPVQGVIAVDVEFLKALLQATGPVEVDGQRVGASNVQQLLYYEQYARMAAGNTTNAQRRDSQSAIAKAAFDALNNPAVDPLTVAKEVATAANGRHLMVWSTDEQADEKWRNAGVGGVLEEDDMMLTVINGGTNKLDQFLEVDANLVTEPKGEEVTSTVEITVRNTAPTTGPRYVLGPVDDRELTVGEYQGMLVMTLPGDTTLMTWDEGLQPVVNGEDGPTVQTGVRIAIKPGETQTFTVRFDRPADAFGTIVLPSARSKPVSWVYGDEKWVDSAVKSIEY